MMRKHFNIGDIEVGKDTLFFILGPCVIESDEVVFHIAETLSRLRAELSIPIIFKASFDKANRSSLNSYRGPGLKAGLKILETVKKSYNLPVLSDIHEPWQAEQVAGVLSVIQIPAFLARQTDLLLAAGRTGLPVNVKKGQFMAPEDMALVGEKIVSTGNEKIMFTERGNFMGYRNLVVDFRNIPIMKKSGFPVVIDATHSVQKPTALNGISGGDPEFIPIIAKAGLVAGADGVFMEVHPNPSSARSDGANSMNLKSIKPLLIGLKKLYNIL